MQGSEVDGASVWMPPDFSPLVGGLDSLMKTLQIALSSTCCSQEAMFLLGVSSYKIQNEKRNLLGQQWSHQRHGGLLPKGIKDSPHIYSRKRSWVGWAERVLRDVGLHCHYSSAFYPLSVLHELPLGIPPCGKGF